MAELETTSGTMQVTYRASAADHWRCQLYSIMATPITLAALLLCPIVMAAILDWSAKGGPARFFEIAVICVAAYVAFYLLMLAATIAQRVNTVPPRYVTTALAPDGVHDIAPEKTTLIPWLKLRKIIFHDGDVFFRVISGSGVYVPRSAFSDFYEARRFYEAAVAAKAGDVSHLAPLSGQDVAAAAPIAPPADRPAISWQIAVKQLSSSSWSAPVWSHVGSTKT